jgi:hypothetical protein
LNRGTTTSSDSDTKKSEKTICSSGPSVPHPKILDSETTSNEDKDISCPFGSDNLDGQSLDRSEEEENVIPSSLSDDVTDHSFPQKDDGTVHKINENDSQPWLSSPLRQRNAEDLSNLQNQPKSPPIFDQLGDIWASGNVDRQLNSPELESSPGAHLVSDATTVCVASSSEDEGGQKIVKQKELEEMKSQHELKESTPITNAPLPYQTLSVVNDFKCNVREKNKCGFDEIKAASGQITSTPGKTKPISAFTSLSPSFDKEEDEGDIVIPTPETISQDNQQETDQVVETNLFEQVDQGQSFQVAVDDAYKQRTHQLSQTQIEEHAQELARISKDKSAKAASKPFASVFDAARDSEDLFDTPHPGQTKKQNSSKSQEVILVTAPKQPKGRSTSAPLIRDETFRSPDLVSTDPKQDQMSLPGQSSTLGPESTHHETIEETDLMEVEETQETVKMNRSALKLKRRRKDIDYKVLSQRGKNRESNAFALRAHAPKVTPSRALKSPRIKPSTVGVISDMKAKESRKRRSTMIVRMAQKKITAARRLEMIRRRSIWSS